MDSQKPRLPGMLKSTISPVQAWLLTQGRCVGCGRSLLDCKKTKIKSGEKVVCECGRIFIFDPKNKKYRRALLEEV